MTTTTITGRQVFRARQKDPAKSPNLDSYTAWGEINQCLPRAIEKVIRPKVLELDAKGCERIIEKMNYDKDLITLQKQFLSTTRESVRQKLKERRQAVDQLHNKSGQPVISGVEFNQFENAVKQIKETENIEVRLSTPRSRIRNAENSMFPATKALQGGTVNDSFQRTVTLSFGGGQSISPERIKQLAQPKHEYEPADIYKH